MPINFKISADGGKNWLNASANDERFELIEKQHDRFIYRLRGLDGFIDEMQHSRSMTEDYFKKNILPPFFHVENFLFDINDPTFYGTKLTVLVRPYTADEQYAECLEYFLSNIDTIETESVSVETHCGKVYVNKKPYQC